MPAKSLPSQDYLLQRLRYEPETGCLWWRRSDLMPFAWNQRYAGELAFTTVTNGYHTGRVDRRRYLAHRIIWMMVYGHEPEQIDHINGDPGDNRLSNLRAATARQNSRNKAKAKNNTSGVCGVSWNKHHSTWQARIGVHGRDVHLGCFETIEAAARARLAAQARFGFAKRHGE